MASSKRQRKSGVRIGTWLMSGGGAIFACVLMASSAAAAGYTYPGPWSKGLVAPTNVIVELSGCSSLTGKAATFSKHTGDAAWIGSASAKSCPSPLGKQTTSTALEQYAVGLTYPVKVPVGIHPVTFNVTWNISAIANYSLTTKGSCPTAVWTGSFSYVSCIAEAISQVINYAELVNLSSGAIYYPTATSGGYPAFAYSYVEKYSYCFNATYCTSYNYSASTPWTSQSTTVNVTYSINATTDSMYQYAIYTYVGGDIVDEFEVYHGSATGAINMKTHGYGAQLIDIVES